MIKTSKLDVKDNVVGPRPEHEEVGGREKQPRAQQEGYMMRGAERRRERTMECGGDEKGPAVNGSQTNVFSGIQQVCCLERCQLRSQLWNTRRRSKRKNG